MWTSSLWILSEDWLFVYFVVFLTKKKTRRLMKMRYNSKMKGGKGGRLGWLVKSRVIVVNLKGR